MLNDDVESDDDLDGVYLGLDKLTLMSQFIYRLWPLKLAPKNLQKFVQLKWHLAYLTLTLSLDIQPKG